MDSWFQPAQQPVYRQRSSLWRSGQWYVAPLRPQGFTSPAELLPGWQPLTSQPVRNRLSLYWHTGGVLVTSPTETPVAENRVDSWFVPTVQPVRRNTLPTAGWWDGPLQPTQFAVPDLPHWNPIFPDPVVPKRLPTAESVFAPQLDFSPSVPSLASWYRPAAQPVVKRRVVDGAFVLGLPPSLVATLAPCPYRPPFVEDTDHSAPTLAAEDELRPITETEDVLRPRTGDCCS